MRPCFRTILRAAAAAALTALAAAAAAAEARPPVPAPAEVVRAACLAAKPKTARPEAVCGCIAANLGAQLSGDELRAVADAYAGRRPAPGVDVGDVLDLDLTTAERCLQEPRYRVPGALRPED